MTAGEAGLLYVLLNPSMPGLVKVGLTTRDSGVRARELGGSTGVPTGFMVAYEAAFADVQAAERHLHDALSAHRVQQGREFFRVAPSFAIDLILELRVNGLYGGAAIRQDPVARQREGALQVQALNQARELYETGMAHETGRGVPRSQYEAVKYYQAAAKAGAPEAHARLGACLLRGYGTEVSVKKGLSILEKGAAMGDLDCLRELAVAHRRQGQADVSRDRWREYFGVAQPTEEACAYVVKLLRLDPPMVGLGSFVERHLTQVLRMWDLSFFADAVTRYGLESGWEVNGLGFFLSTLQHSALSDASQLLGVFRQRGLVNSSAVLHAAEESSRREQLQYARPYDRLRVEPEPGWCSWEEADRITGALTRCPDLVPPQLNDPFEMLDLASSEAFLKRHALWKRRYDGEGMKTQAPKRRRR